MTTCSKILQVAAELDRYLQANDFFDSSDETQVNEAILEGWNGRFLSAISGDLQSAIDNISVDVIQSEFEIESPDEHGACLFFHKLAITDLITSESLQVNSKILVSHNKASVYLGSSYANVDQWKGESRKLRSIFNKLKVASKSSGYFSPISWGDLIK